MSPALLEPLICLCRKDLENLGYLCLLRSRKGLPSIAVGTEQGSCRLLGSVVWGMKNSTGCWNLFLVTPVVFRSCQRESQMRRLGSQQLNGAWLSLSFFSCPFCSCSGQQTTTEGQIWNSWSMAVCVQGCRRGGEDQIHCVIILYLLWRSGSSIF